MISKYAVGHELKPGSSNRACATLNDSLSGDLGLPDRPGAVWQKSAMSHTIAHSLGHPTLPTTRMTTPNNIKLIICLEHGEAWSRHVSGLAGASKGDVGAPRQPRLKRTAGCTRGTSSSRTLRRGAPTDRKTNLQSNRQPNRHAQRTTHMHNFLQHHTTYRSRQRPQSPSQVMRRVCLRTRPAQHQLEFLLIPEAVTVVGRPAAAGRRCTKRADAAAAAAAAVAAYGPARRSENTAAAQPAGRLAAAPEQGVCLGNNPHRHVHTAQALALYVRSQQCLWVFPGSHL